MKKALLSIGLVALFVVAGLVFTSQSKVAAVSMCGVLAPATSAPPPNSNCLYGQNYNALTGLSGGSDSLKSQFISRMHSFESGQHPQRVGAAWVEAHLYSRSDMSWENRINQSDVRLVEANFSYSTNTAYKPSTDSIVTYSDSGTSYSLLFQVQKSGTWTTYFAIKEDCGNPLGSLPGLPAPPSPPPVLQGYKVSTTGSSSGPYSDDKVSAYQSGSYVHGDTDEPFFFTNNVQLSAGTYTIKLSDAGTSDGSWKFVGYTLCDAADKSCSLDPSNYTAAGSGGFSVTLKDGHTYNMRAVYAQNGAPSGTITASCSTATQGSVSATFKDPDTSSTYPLSATLMVGGTPYNKTVSSSPGSMGPYTVTIPNTGSVTITLTVKDVGPTASSANNFTTSKTLSGSSCAAPSGTTCPTFTTNPQTVNLPAQNAPWDTTGSGYASSPNQTAYQYQPSGNFQIDTVHDQYGQTARNSSGGSGWSSTSKSTNPFYIYYDGWINDYPYDTHTITINYQTYYNRLNYISSSSPTYYCPYGGYVSGSTCYYSATPEYGSCPSGDWQSGSYCYKYDSTTGYWNYDGQAPIVGYSCSWPASPSGSTCTYGAYIYGYQYIYQNTTTDQTHTSGSTSAPTLPECYNRNFDVQDAGTQVNSVNLDDQEHPSRVTIGWGTQVEFSLTHGGIGVRNPAQVNGLSFAATYTIKHADGSEVPFNPSSDSTSFSVGSSSPTPSSPGYVSYNSSRGPFSATVPPLQPGDEICATFTVTPEGTEVNEYGTIQSNNGQPVTADEKCSAPVYNEPYVQFFGNDVSAGGAFGTAGCGNPGNISTNWYSGGPPSRGSSVQFGALSFGTPSGGTINNFASASLRTSPPRAPNGLNFANVSGTQGIGGQHCVPDFYATKPSDTFSGSINTSTSNAYSYSGDQSLSAMSIGNGANVTVYVDGDVYIGGNITYANTSWPTLDDVPSFFLIVKGDIYISPSVTQLDGVYVAQNGMIDTCADGFSSYPASAIYQNCGPWSGNGYTNTQLIVNGAFIANQVRLHRAFSSLRHSTSYENPNGGSSHNCDVENGAYAVPELDCAAEIFNFSPETYLGNPVMNEVAGPDKDKYDYLTSLSPVL